MKDAPFDPVCQDGNPIALVEADHTSSPSGRHGMNAMTPFNFQGANVRVIERDGEPWFVAKDVATVLGYVSARDAIARHCKAAISDGVAFHDAIGREQKYAIIPERDVYRLIFRSRMPQAEAFEEWVVGVVLPAIRKSGAYIAGEEKLATGEIAEDELIRRAFIALNVKVEAQGKQIEAQGQTIDRYCEYVTTREYISQIRRETGEVMDRDMTKRVGVVAGGICRRQGIKVDRVPIRYKWRGEEKEGQICVYPRKILDQAYAWVRGKAA